MVAPASLTLLSGKGRPQAFTVRLRPELSSLAPGVHFARVGAYLSTDPARGELFSLPVTVIVPHSTHGGKSLPMSPGTPIRSSVAASPALPVGLDAALPAAGGTEPPVAVATSDSEASFALSPRSGEPERRFVSVPEQAQWLELKLSTGQLPEGWGELRLVAHVVASARGDSPASACALGEGRSDLKRGLALRPHSEARFAMPVRGGATLELCVGLTSLANPAGAQVTNPFTPTASLLPCFPASVLS